MLTIAEKTKPVPPSPREVGEGPFVTPAGAPPGDGDRPRRDPLAILAAPAFELTTARRLAS